VVATLGVIFAALYLLWAYQQVFHGKPKPADEKTRDLSWAERGIIAPLIILIVVLGIYPKPVLDRITPSVNRLVDRVELVTHTHQPPVARFGTNGQSPGDGEVRTMSALAVVTAHSTIVLPHIRYLAILPEIVMLGGAVLLLGIASLVRRRCGSRYRRSAPCDRRTRSASPCGSGRLSSHGPYTAIDHAVVVDGFSVLITITVACAMILSALVATGTCGAEGVDGASSTCSPWSRPPGDVHGEANDLIIVFLGLEIMSIALYVLAAMNHRRAASGEAALKYFVLGGFSSAVFIYGVALTYGATGTTNLTQIADFLSHNVIASNGVLLAGLSLLLVASCSRSPPSRSTCGPRRSTRARRRRSPGSWRPSPRPAASPPCFGCSCPRSARCRATGAPSSTPWPSSRCSSGRVARPRRVSGSCVLLDQPRRVVLLGVRRPPQGVSARSTTCSPYTFMTIGAFAVVTLLVAAATGTTTSPATAASPAASRCWPWRSPSLLLPKPARRSPPGSSPSSRWSTPR